MWTRGFTRYWSATTVSNLGSGVTLVALPILAAQQLHAGAAELGYLRALEAAPYVLLALVVGHLADRWQPLHLMIASDIARAVLLAGVVFATLTGRLTLAALAVAVFVVGAFAVTYDIAQFTFMPAIVPRPAMTAANSAVELARGAAFTFGPGLGGLLTALLRAAPSLALDAVSYVYSALVLTTLRVRRVQRAPGDQRTGRQARGQAADGLRFLVEQPELRTLTEATVDQDAPCSGTPMDRLPPNNRRTRFYVFRPDEPDRATNRTSDNARPLQRATGAGRSGPA